MLNSLTYVNVLVIPNQCTVTHTSVIIRCAVENYTISLNWSLNYYLFNANNRSLFVSA